MKTEDKPALLWTAQQAAPALAISKRKLWQMTKDGTVPHVKIGRSVRYPADELRAWLAAQLKGGAR